MKKSIVIIPIFIVILFSRTSAQETFTVQEAIAYSIEHSMELETKAIDLEITKAKNSEITGLAYPQISANSGFNYYFKKPVILFPDFISPAVYGVLMQENIIPYDPSKLSGDGYNAVSMVQTYGFTGNLQLSQLLFEPSVFVGLMAREVLVELNSKSQAVTERDIKEKITKAYYGLLISYKKLELLQSNIDLLENLYKTVSEYYKNGFIEKLEMDKVEVNLNNLKTEKVKVNNTIGMVKDLLKFQMNYPLDQNIQLKDSINNDQLKDIDDLMVQEVKAQNAPEFELLNLSKKLNELDIKRYKLSHLPTVAAFANYGFNSPSNTFNYFDKNANYFKQGLVGLTVNLPIFNGMATKARMKAATLNVLKTELNIRQLDYAYQLQNKTLKTNLYNSKMALQNAENNVKLSKDVYTKTLAKYNQGVGSNLEVLQANNELKTSMTNYYDAMYNCIIAKIDLQKALNKI